MFNHTTSEITENTMPLLPQSGTLGLQRAAHLLRRAAFGATHAQINYFSGLSAAQAINALFGNTLPPAPAPVDPETGTTWTDGPTDPDRELEYQELFVRWYLGRVLGSGDPEPVALATSAREKIVFFMHSYFTTMRRKVVSGRALYYQNALFRSFALDSQDDPLGPRDFRTLVKKVSLDNAMMRFLDGSGNVKGSPNENYAREMLELYTIGRGLEGSNPPATEPGDYIHYTEQDVRAAANVLTGYQFDETFSNIDPETGLPTCVIRGNGGAHEQDDSLKVFSARFDNQQISQNPALMAGTEPTWESMTDELDQLVAMIFGKRETALHVCRKLYRYYVHYDITPELDADIISAMADVFIASGYRIQPVIEALLTSTHFFESLGGVEDDKFGGIIKSPLEIIAGTFTLLEVQIPNQQTQPVEFNELAGDLLRLVERQGMELYEPNEVAGYAAYHQFPKFNRNWITTNYLVQRYDFIRTLLDNNMGNWNIRYFVSQHFNGVAGDARQLIMALAPYFYPLANNLDFNGTGGSITGERLSYFLYAFLTANQYTEAEWTALYADAAANYLEIDTLLKSLFNAMLQTPEFQLH